MGRKHGLADLEDLPGSGRGREGEWRCVCLLLVPYAAL